jgi:hypothetical protein
MKNWFFLGLLLIFAHQSFSMEGSDKKTKVLYHSRFDDTVLPSFVWEQIANADMQNVEEKGIEACIIDPENKVHIIGSFLDK